MHNYHRSVVSITRLAHNRSFLLALAAFTFAATSRAQFSQPLNSPFSVGNYPFSVAVGDFNGDGIPDLVFANEGSTNVSVLLGDGHGGFTAAANSPFNVGSSPVFIAVGDLNNDGKQDLAVACSIANQVVVLLGDGAGGFTPASGSPFAAASQPSSIAVGDFNADGKMDLAVSTYNSGGVGTLIIMLGNGAGGFGAASGSPITVGHGARSLALGDFNGDAKLDVAVVNQLDSNVTVLLGNGSGGFSAAGSPVAVGQGPVSIVASDLNRDGKLDLAVVNNGSNNVTVLLGDGSGGFTASGGSPISVGQGPNSIAAGNFSGSSKLDLVVGNSSVNSLTVLVGNGSGGFSPATYSPISLTVTPIAVAAADVNGDGSSDIVVAGGSTGQGAVLLNTLPSHLIPRNLGVFRSGQWWLDGGGDFRWTGPPDRLFYLGQAGDIPIMGDWTNSGVIRAGVFRDGQWWLDLNNDGAWDAVNDIVFNFGQAGDVPVFGDWDGTGVQRIGIFRNGQWWLDINNDHAWDVAHDIVFYFGQAGDVPVIGDWDSTGRQRIGIFRSGQWWLDLNGDHAWDVAHDTVFYFGQTSDLPVVGDWTHTGQTRIGIFRAGQWWLDLNGDHLWDLGHDLVTYFGISTDNPVVGQ